MVPSYNNPRGETRLDNRAMHCDNRYNSRGLSHLVRPRSPAPGASLLSPSSSLQLLPSVTPRTSPLSSSPLPPRRSPWRPNERSFIPVGGAFDGDDLSYLAVQRPQSPTICVAVDRPSTTHQTRRDLRRRRLWSPPSGNDGPQQQQRQQQQQQQQQQGMSRRPWLSSRPSGPGPFNAIILPQTSTSTLPTFGKLAAMYSPGSVYAAAERRPMSRGGTMFGGSGGHICDDEDDDLLHEARICNVCQTMRFRGQRCSGCHGR